MRSGSHGIASTPGVDPRACLLLCLLARVREIIERVLEIVQRADAEAPERK
jgi:hypothetical protein